MESCSSPWFDTKMYMLLSELISSFAVPCPLQAAAVAVAVKGDVDSLPAACIDVLTEHTWDRLLPHLMTRNHPSQPSIMVIQLSNSSSFLLLSCLQPYDFSLIIVTQVYQKVFTGLRSTQVWEQHSWLTVQLALHVQWVTQFHWNMDKNLISSDTK